MKWTFLKFSKFLYLFNFITICFKLILLFVLNLFFRWFFPKKVSSDFFVRSALPRPVHPHQLPFHSRHALRTCWCQIAVQKQHWPIDFVFLIWLINCDVAWSKKFLREIRHTGNEDIHLKCLKFHFVKVCRRIFENPGIFQNCFSQNN